ncbi:MAG: hypothetical protein ACXAAH_03320 [Promethearchaeota archaeon]|jgi:hypothetical protein
MEEQKFGSLVEALREQEGIEEIFLLNSEGDIVYKSGEFQLTNEEAKAILTAWKTKEPAIMFQGYRFAVLKNDDIQLAARNIVGGKGNVVGSITKEGEYLVAHTRDEGLIILEWSIFINKVAWS